MQRKFFIFCLASVEAILYFVPLQDPVALQDPRVAHLVQYAIIVEKSTFENARSRVSTITVYIIIILTLILGFLLSAVS